MNAPQEREEARRLHPLPKGTHVLTNLSRHAPILDRVLHRIRLEEFDVREPLGVVVLVREDGDAVDGAARLEVLGEFLRSGGVVDASDVDGAGVSLGAIGVGTCSAPRAMASSWTSSATCRISVFGVDLPADRRLEGVNKVPL